MHSSTWKAFERKIAKCFGGTRRGPNVGSGTIGSGLDDVVGTPGDAFSIECKYSKQPSYGLVRTAAREAHLQALPHQMPVGVVGKMGETLDGVIVVMLLSDFLEWHVHNTVEEDSGKD